MIPTNKEKFDNTKEIKNRLAEISPTFCTAKWLQSTILLYNGETHSCHHPSRHKIPVEGLKENPSQIHNTPIKIHARQDLLKGIQTPECEYCWRIENLKIENQSDRIFKSAAEWAIPYFQEVVDSGLGKNIEPSYLEIAFESTCNFACMYCTPEVSTRWMEDVESHGRYNLSGGNSLHSPHYLKQVGKYPIHRDDYNPYVEAFWAWWPVIYPKLQVFRITGGEPLLSKHTWKIFNWIKENPNPDLEFAVNTNLGVPRKLITKLVNEAKEISGKVKEFKIFTSLEATGKHAEYIRYGLNYGEFMDNLDYVLTELPNTRVVFMTTVNVLSVFTFRNFLKEIIRLRAKFNKDAACSRVGLSVNYLRWPNFMDIRIMDKDLLKFHMDGMVSYMYTHLTKVPGYGEALFYLEEIDQLERLREYALQEIPNREVLVEDFKLFFEQYDKRRGLDFDETFNGFLLTS